MNESVLTKIARMKYEPDENWDNFYAALTEDIKSLFDGLKGSDAE